ncbi:MAG: hypothetical protein N4A35_09705 [Flavobacteriales bacterium]|jgi:hypothetical protein|nr:hypothetical protein [Flavobacteriales bacterium]
MKKGISMLLLSSLTLWSIAQSNIHFGGRSAGMAHASVTLSDVWSTHHNQAGLAWLKSPSAGVYYQNKFTVSELSNLGLAYAHPLKKGAFAIQWSNFGYALYQENKVGLAYALQLSEKLSGGVQLDYLSTRLGGIYGANTAFAAEIGLQAKLTQKLTIGAHVYNPTRTTLNDYNNEAIATIMRLGLGYQLSEKVNIVVETEKDVDHLAALKTGIEYNANNKLYFRGGVSTGPTLGAFGFGLNLEQYQLNIATTYHQTLGFSPEISFTYQFKKK